MGQYAGPRGRDLVELPPMTDPEIQAAVRILTFLFAPASLLDNELFYLLICTAANLTLRYGIDEPSIHIYSGLAQVLGQSSTATRWPAIRRARRSTAENTASRSPRRISPWSARASGAGPSRPPSTISA